MRPSFEQTNVARLRVLTGLRQKELAPLVGLKLSSLQKLETKSLALSAETAKRIAFETGVSACWLQSSDTGLPPVTPSGRPYAESDYTATRAARTASLSGKRPPRVGDLAHQYVHLRAVAAAADRQGQGDSFMFELDAFLERARSQYGYRAEVFGGSSRAKHPLPSTSQVLKRVADDLATLTRDHASRFGEDGIPPGPAQSTSAGPKLRASARKRPPT